MSEIWGVPSLNRSKTTLQLKGNFNGLRLPNKTRYRQFGQVRWQLQGVSYIVPKHHERWSTNGL